jgi:TIR domain
MLDRFLVRSAESGARPTRIFVNYRREVAAPYAGRLYDALAERFGEANVFMDVDTIALGTDFTDAIERALASCDAVVRSPPGALAIVSLPDKAAPVRRSSAPPSAALRSTPPVPAPTGLAPTGPRRNSSRPQALLFLRNDV